MSSSDHVQSGCDDRVPATPPGRVIVIGSANEDIVATAPRLPRPGETVTGRGVSILSGGKSANQAVAAARFGARVCFVGAVGADAAGRRAVESLTNEGVDVTHISVLPHERTGTALIMVSDDGDNLITVVAGANGSVDGALVDAALADLDVAASDVCLVCFEIGDEAVQAVARRSALCGATLVVNPAPARPLPTTVASASPILVPNETEAMHLARTDDYREAAHRLAAQTGAPVVATLGPLGALIVTEDVERQIPSLPVTAVDSTGAGDTLCGVLAAGLAEGLVLESAVERAVAAASLSVTALGARPGSPPRSRVDEAVRQLFGT